MNIQKQHYVSAITEKVPSEIPNTCTSRDETVLSEGNAFKQSLLECHQKRCYYICAHFSKILLVLIIHLREKSISVVLCFSETFVRLYSHKHVCIG